MKTADYDNDDDENKAISDKRHKQQATSNKQPSPSHSQSRVPSHASKTHFAFIQ